MSWIQHPTTLSGQTVTLVPLEEKQFSILQQVAADKRIWQHYVFDGSEPKRLSEILYEGLQERERDSHYPFTIIEKSKNVIIGCTRYMNIQAVHRNLEIGHTWLHPDYWGTAINLECKLLLLTHAFEALNAVRVQLKTDENNIRSRKAIEKIGGRFEGILRSDMIRDNGTFRSSAYFSILKDEWPEVKLRLTNLFADKL